MIALKDIDVWFDVQTDSNGKDPDSASKTLKLYHQALWSKPLPNGQMMQLEIDKGCLRWDDMWFGCDSITASFLNGRKPIGNLELLIPDFPKFKLDYWHHTYTIGGSIIFPMHRWSSMNQARGCHPRICDRWDLTLECIKRYYNRQESPLTKAIQKSEDFFNLFVDFKGYVDFFLLQDCVDDNYNVNYYIDNPEFGTVFPLPKTLDEYMKWIASQLEFVAKRNKRIQDYCYQNVTGTGN